MPTAKPFPTSTLFMIRDVLTGHLQSKRILIIFGLHVLKAHRQLF